MKSWCKSCKKDTFSTRTGQCLLCLAQKLLHIFGL
jgi:hypothetical protein